MSRAGRPLSVLEWIYVALIAGGVVYVILRLESLGARALVFIAALAIAAAVWTSTRPDDDDDDRYGDGGGL